MCTYLNATQTLPKISHSPSKLLLANVFSEIKKLNNPSIKQTTIKTKLKNFLNFTHKKESNEKALTHKIQENISNEKIGLAIKRPNPKAKKQ